MQYFKKILYNIEHIVALLFLIHMTTIYKYQHVACNTTTAQYITPGSSSSADSSDTAAAARTVFIDLTIATIDPDRADL